MLESWIIDAIRREERAERERQQPQLEIPQPEWLPRPSEKVERRGVVILPPL